MQCSHPNSRLREFPFSLITLIDAFELFGRLERDITPMGATKPVRWLLYKPLLRRIHGFFVLGSLW